MCVCVECEADTSLPPALRKITITPHMHAAHFNCAAFMHTHKHTLRISAGTVFYGGLAHRLRHPRTIHASSQHRRQHGRRTDYEHGPWPPFQAAHGARLQVRRTGPYLWNTHLLRDICIEASARDYDSKLRRSPALVDPCCASVCVCVMQADSARARALAIDRATLSANCGRLTYFFYALPCCFQINSACICSSRP